MSVLVGKELCLLDSQERQIGRVLIERIDGDLLLGRFIPGKDFQAVEQLFCDFEEAVNAQALSLVEEIDLAIAALVLHLAQSNGSQEQRVYDVQIWNDGGFSCRLSELAPSSALATSTTSRLFPPG